MRNTKKVLMPLADGVEEMEAVIIADVLRRAGIEIVLAGLADGGATVTASRGVRLLPDAAWNGLHIGDFDALALPGGMGGVNAMLADHRVLAAIRDFMAAKKIIGAICAAPLALQAAGVLAGRRITSFRGVAARLSGCQWLDERVVIDDNLITSRGPGTAMEFALAMAKFLTDAPAVENAASSLG